MNKNVGNSKLGLFAKKSVKTNDLAFLPQNGYRSLMSVFHTIHDLPLHVAWFESCVLRLEIQLSVQMCPKR